MNFRNVGLLARYEAKTISREWSFRVIAVLTVLIVTFLHGITQSNLVEPEWIAISLPSAIPYANAYLIDILLILVVIFYAGNYLLEKHPEGANSVLSARPYSNMELVWVNGPKGIKIRSGDGRPGKSRSSFILSNSISVNKTQETKLLYKKED